MSCAEMPYSEIPPQFRPSRKLLRAVADLHTRGYQRLRVAVSQYELGTWRCSIAPAIWISGDHGAELHVDTDYGRLANYSSADEREYWGWLDAHHASPARLAEEFLGRFPDLAILGYGQDWPYAGWFQHMLHLTYPDALPVAHVPFERKPTDYVGSLGRFVRIPLPPPGYALVRGSTAG